MEDVRLTPAALLQVRRMLSLQQRDNDIMDGSFFVHSFTIAYTFETKSSANGI